MGYRSSAPPFKRARHRHKGSASRFLSHQEEIDLSRAWRDQADIAARNRMVSAHLPLARSMAFRATRVSGDQEEVFQEAVFGLIRAAEKFDPDMGWRFATYAAWWIRAEIQKYLLRNRSVLTWPTTPEFKTLFYSLSKTLDRIEQVAREQGEHLSPAEIRSRASVELAIPVSRIDEFLMVCAQPVMSLNQRSRDGAGDESSALEELIKDRNADQAAALEAVQQDRQMQAILAQGLAKLTGRERDILTRRYLNGENCQTLNEIALIYGVTGECIRQNEAKAIGKIRTYTRNMNLGRFDLREPM